MLGLTFSDILFASIMALVITWSIRTFAVLWKVFKNPGTIELKGDSEITNILQKCYSLFPKEIVQFGGQTFKRGMKVKIITNQHKTIEGKLIGMNNENIVCVITQKFIIAHEMSNIEQMSPIDNNN